MDTTDPKGKALEVGDFCHNIESGFLGRIVAFEPHPHDGDTMAKMHGVDTTAWYVGGLSMVDSVDEKDVQWHSPKDLVFFTRLVEPYPG